MKLFLLFLLMCNVSGFKNIYKHSAKISSTKLFMEPPDMINYLTSFKDYTIITRGYKSTNLEEIMIKNNMQVYYVNIDNLLDKDDIELFLRNKYKNIYYDDDVWAFHKGFYIGSSSDILELIKNKR